MLLVLQMQAQVTYLWDYDELVALRDGKGDAARRKWIIDRAEEQLKVGIVRITDKTNTISGDKHNFESLSIYYWPDPQHPGGAYVCRDGEYNPEYKQYDLPRLLTLTENIMYPAQAYFVTGDTRYRDYLCRQLDVWFVDKKTRMNPHFEYGQFIPGRNNGRGNSAGMIDAYTFNNILDGIRLADDVKSLGRSRNKKLKKWFSQFAKWMQTSDIGQGASRFTNNQGVAYDITLYNIAAFTGDNDRCRELQSSFRSKRLQSQILPTGEQSEETRRTKAFSYSVYNLQHIVDFLTMLHQRGERIDEADVRLVQSALDYLAQFIGHRSSFPYQEIGDWNQEEAKLKQLIERFERIKRDNVRI